MKWVLVNNKRNILLEYRLTETDEIKAIVKYNPNHRSARITIGNTHRLFFIESAGALSGKYVFKNEYGVWIGSMNKDKWGKDGSLSVEEVKFSYVINDDKLLVYKENDNKIMVSCGMTTGINGTPLSIASPAHNADATYLLLGLCWFLSQPVTKEKMVEYAA